MNASTDQAAPPPPSIDPITFAVVKSGLDTIVDDMAYTVMRTARSSIVRDVLDYSATISDRRGRILTQGRSIGQRIGAGKTKVIKNIEYMDRVEKGDVLVTDMTDPDWEPVMKRAAAIVTRVARIGANCAKRSLR